MDLSQPKPRAARFGLFDADFEERTLTKGGVRIRIQGQPFQVLAMLLDRPGELVTREEIRQRLWPADTFVEFDDGLNTAIKKLRAALNDSADNPRFIETVPRRGYRFLASVEMSSKLPVLSGTGSQPSLGATKNGNGVGNRAESGSTLSPLVQSPCTEATVVEQTPAPLVIARQIPVAPLLVAAVAVLILGVLGLVNWRRAANPLRAVITLPSELRLMPAREGLGLAISPDGTQLVFSAVGPENHSKLWLRRLASLTPEAIPGTEDATFPFWSPDGENLGFFAGRALKRVNLADHSVRTLCAIGTGRGGTWSREGVILLSSGTLGPIYKVSAEGGVPAPVTTLHETHYTSHRWPEFLPDGKHFVYLAVNHDKSGSPAAIFLGSLEAEPERLLGESDSNAVPVPGSLLFVSHGKLIAQSLDLEKRVVDSRANIIAESVGYDPGSWYGSFVATATEVVYRPRQEKPENERIAWFDRTGNKLRDAGPPGQYREIGLSPDGRTIAAACGDPARNICLIHGDGTVTQVAGDGINGGPTWSSDSTFISYFAHRRGKDSGIAIKPLDGKTPERMLMISSDTNIASFHPDNRHALLARDNGTGSYQYFIFDLTSSKVTPYLIRDGDLSGVRLSPDGRFVAYSKPVNGRDQIHIASYPLPSQDYTLTGLMGRGPKWRGDGRELYFLGPQDDLCAVPVIEANGRLRFGEPQKLFHPPIPPAPWDADSFDVSPDGARFVMITITAEEPSQFVLTTNWQR